MLLITDNYHTIHGLCVLFHVGAALSFAQKHVNNVFVIVTSSIDYTYRYKHEPHVTQSHTASHTVRPSAFTFFALRPHATWPHSSFVIPPGGSVKVSVIVSLCPSLAATRKEPTSRHGSTSKFSVASRFVVSSLRE